MSELLPDGIDDVRDLPHTVFGLIRRALVFLSFDELLDDERPPRRMWLDDEALEAHFKTVRQRRKEGLDPEKRIEDPVQNDAASLLIAE